MDPTGQELGIWGKDWAVELFTLLLDAAWDPRLPEDLRNRTSSSGLVRAEVHANIVDLDFDLEQQTVTILGIWAEEDELPEATVPLDIFWLMIDAKAEDRDWRAHLPS